MKNAMNAAITGELTLTAPQALDDGTLDNAIGGVNCSQAIRLAGVYLALSKVASVIGDPVTAGNMAGRAQGVLEGGCS